MPRQIDHWQSALCQEAEGESSSSGEDEDMQSSCASSEVDEELPGSTDSRVAVSFQVSGKCGL